MSNKVILYGIAGPKDNYRVVRYEIFDTDHDNFSVSWIRFRADRMYQGYPNIKKVYLMDERRGLKREYQDAFRENSIESWIIFKDTLEREGGLFA